MNDKEDLHDTVSDVERLSKGLRATDTSCPLFGSGEEIHKFFQLFVIEVEQNASSLNTHLDGFSALYIYYLYYFHFLEVL